MQKFKCSFNGYNKKQVNEFISESELKYQSNESTYKEKINILEEELKELKREVSNYKNQESNLSKGLIKISELENKLIEDNSKLREAELERIEIFKAKWEEYANRVIGASGENVIECFNSMIIDFNKSVENCIEDNLKLDKTKVYLNTDYQTNDAQKLANLCRKLGILDE